MSDQTSGLNNEEKEKALQWMKTTGQKCGCGQAQCWTVADHIVAPWTFIKGNRKLSLGEAIYPLLMISCDHCNNIKFFDAIALGIFDKDQSVDVVLGGGSY